MALESWLAMEVGDRLVLGLALELPVEVSTHLLTLRMPEKVPESVEDVDTSARLRLFERWLMRWHRLRLLILWLLFFKRWFLDLMLRLLINVIEIFMLGVWPCVEMSRRSISVKAF